MTNQDIPDSYHTLAGTGEAETKVQRSRFIALAAPAPDPDAARAVVDAMARRYHDSRHVCFGWRLGHHPSTQENRNDAGEPSGTAGEPILAAIRKRDLVNTVVVVVRYFGGVKLGTGGLQRAYGEAAELALAAAPVQEVLLGREFDLEFPYPLRKTVDHLLAKARGRVVREEYSDRISWRIWLPHSTWSGFATALTEATAGALNLSPLPPE